MHTPTPYILIALVDAVYDMTRYGMMSEIASTCLTSETGRHNHRKVATKTQIIGTKTPDPLSGSGMCYSVRKRVLQYVFSAVNAKRLPPRQNIDKESIVAIELQEGKQLPYLYPLSPAKLEAFRKYIQENSAKRFI